MTPKTKNGPERMHPLEAYGTATREGRRTMTDHTEYAHFELQADAPRTSVGEFTANLLLIALALIVTYCAVVGAVHTLIALGVSA